jgi:hypothetical protein
MAINGRINVDVLFHDTDGTTSLKVVSLEGATEYTTGKVAIVSGTVGTTSVTLWATGNAVGFGGYKNAAGSEVVLNSVSRIALRGSGSGVEIKDTDLQSIELVSVGNDLAIGNSLGANLSVSAIDGTASFTAVLYGS